MESLKRYYRMDRRAIHLLRFFLEAYDGIAGLSTIDARAGLVVLHVAPGCEDEVAALIEEMQQDILLQPVEPPMEGRGAAEAGGLF
jgi:hypothetical protein